MKIFFIGVIFLILYGIIVIPLSIKTDEYMREALTYEKQLLEIRQFKLLRELEKFTKGKASWYDYDLPNKPGYSKATLTAASRAFPRGTKLRVCHGNCIYVVVNDFVRNPNVIIDLSSAAFSKLAPLERGIIPVEVARVE